MLQLENIVDGFWDTVYKYAYCIIIHFMTIP